MNRRSLVALSVGLTVVVTACHHKKPETAPTPVNSTAAPPPAPPPPPSMAPPPPSNTNGSDIDGIVTRRVATMSDRIHFDYDKSDIKPEDTQKLDGKGALLKQFSALRIRITGHCDERGSDQYNIALGMRRATAAKTYLVQLGIDASRIDVASLGREVPIDPGHDEAAWAQNRRDEFDIIAGSQSLRAP
ncbi:MAG TPA: OmpA family protein [Gemmatimonadales bacterium]|jgi:peptidoglycan-associated lipoprotein